jgi:phosphoglycerate dehydrogenase-like enzyme
MINRARDLATDGSDLTDGPWWSRSPLTYGLRCVAELLYRCMDLELQGRVALVVGGTGLIGQAIVERLRAEGATAIVAARHATEGIVLDARDTASVTTAIV